MLGRRLIILGSYLIVLAGSPLGHSAMLRYHISTQHAPSSAVIDHLSAFEVLTVALEAQPHVRGADHTFPGYGHEHGKEHWHQHEQIGHRQHDHAPESQIGSEHAHVGADSNGHPHPPLAAAEQPHQHSGFVHTHGVPPEGEIAPFGFALMQFYLSPVVTTLPTLALRRVQLWPASEKIQSPAIAVATPPPQQLS